MSLSGINGTKALEDKAELYFKSVGGLKYETEAIPVVSGGENTTTFQLVGATKWANIVLKRGFTISSSMLSYREQWLYGARKRFDGTITQLDSTLQHDAVTWNFRRAWPVKWEISEFDAGKSELAIETLELAHDGLWVAGGPGAKQGK